MIQANELRMGILIEKDNVMYKFLSLEQNHASTSQYRMYFVETLDGKLGKYYSSHFKPIPLTPEILEKCGFEITGQTEHPNNIWTKYGEESKFELEQIIHFFLYDNKCFGTQVNYLHQLQNLYFALAGEELIYTP